MTSRVVVALSLFAAVVAACVIAEPPTDLPELPAQPPTIVRSGLVPVVDRVLTRWPEKFVVPVRLTNPRSPVAYSYFIDYNPATGDGFINADESTLEIGATPGATRRIEVAIPEPSPGCHVVEIVVGLAINPSDGRNAHTPLPPGGDSVTWFYNPGGTLAGCPALDAKLAPDAAALLSYRDGGG